MVRRRPVCWLGAPSFGLHRVWAVSEGDDAALRVDPETGGVERFPVGDGPYTYSDMTGFQLRTVTVY